MTEPIRQFPHMTYGFRWSDFVAALDPKDPDTATVLAEVREAGLVPVSDEDLRRMQATINRSVAAIAAVTAIPPNFDVSVRHPDGWGPCPDGCPCTACDVPEPQIEVVAETPHTRGWLHRWARTLKRGSK